MARSNKLTKASVFEDTNTHQRFGEAMSKTHRFDADSSRQAQLFTVANTSQLDLVM